jgi:hypothetical protein
VRDPAPSGRRRRLAACQPDREEVPGARAGLPSLPPKTTPPSVQPGYCGSNRGQTPRFLRVRPGAPRRARHVDQPPLRDSVIAASPLAIRTKYGPPANAPARRPLDLKPSAPRRRRAKRPLSPTTHDAGSARNLRCATIQEHVAAHASNSRAAHSPQNTATSSSHVKNARQPRANPITRAEHSTQRSCPNRNSTRRTPSATRSSRSMHDAIPSAAQRRNS